MHVVGLLLHWEAQCLLLELQGLDRLRYRDCRCYQSTWQFLLLKHRIAGLRAVACLAARPAEPLVELLAAIQLQAARLIVLIIPAVGFITDRSLRMEPLYTSWLIHSL